MSEQSTRGNVVAFQKSADFLRECAARNQHSDLLRALDFLHRALELEPGNADILMEEAELLNEMDCPYESTLALGRAVSGGRVPREACFGLASNLVSMGLLDPAICALRLYLAENAQGENARSARELLSLTQLGVEARFQSRRTRRASRLCAGAIRLMRAGRYERARLLVQRALRDDPQNRQLLMMQVKCDLYTGRAEDARALADYLSRDGGEDDLLMLALVLSEKEGNDDLIERLLGDQSTQEPEECLAVFRICLNRGDGERIHRLLPRLLRDAPYDRGVLHAAAMDALKYGQNEEKARWYWQRMLRIRPSDGLAAQCLACPEADGPWQARLSGERTRELMEQCERPGEQLIPLTRWALDAQQEDALRLLCPQLAREACPEAEALLREALAHPMLEAGVKQLALSALVRRGARPPYLYVTGEEVALQAEACAAHRPAPHALEPLFEAACAGMETICPEARERLERLWRELAARYDVRRDPRRIERLAPALICLAMEEDGAHRVARLYGLSERRLRFDAARLRGILRRNERKNPEERGEESIGDEID